MGIRHAVFASLVALVMLFALRAHAFYISFAFWGAPRALNASWTPAWSGLVEYLPLDGAPGSIANGATIPATIGGSGSANGAGLSYGSGHIAQAMVTTGSPDIMIPAASSPNPGSQLTLALWFQSTNANTGGSYPSLLWKSDMTAGWALAQNNNTSGQLYVRVDTTAGSNQTSGALQGVFDGNWHHLVYTLNNGTITAYLDGVNVPSAGGTYSVGGGFANSSQNLYIGEAMGSYDEVAIWNVALTAAQVTTLYDRQR